MRPIRPVSSHVALLAKRVLRQRLFLVLVISPLYKTVALRLLGIGLEKFFSRQYQVGIGRLSCFF